MTQRIILVLLAVAVQAGCSMCQDMWDYARPTKGSPPVPYAGTTSRAGSAFSSESNVANVDPTAAPVMPAAPEEIPSREWEPPERLNDPVTRQPNRPLPQLR